MNATTTAGAGNRKKRLWLGLGAVAALLAILLGGYFLLAQSLASWKARWAVDRYLKQQTGRSSFTVEFPFPSKAEMAKVEPKEDKNTGPQKGKRTGKDFDTLRDEYLKLKSSMLRLENRVTEAEQELVMRSNLVENLEKQVKDALTSAATNANRLAENLSNQVRRIAYVQENLPAWRQELKKIPDMEKELAPITADLWDFQRAFAAMAAANPAMVNNDLQKAQMALATEHRKRLNEAKSYSAMYQVIGETLYVAKRLLASANLRHQRAGVSMVLQAMQYCWNDAQNNWLAARLAEGYLWPHLDVAEDDRRSPLSVDMIINTCVGAFRANNEPEKVMQSYELLMRINPQRADWAHLQIARIYEQEGNLAAALKSYRSIQNTNDNRWVSQAIQRLEQRVKQ
ncbi:hypothetical protein NXS98_01055 [Fontisphaera persica]|uniref:hypothetical protein n=1 Tax=Fontisphaera persica TaxID=2974023 RepID=UPI0024BF2BF6|nr:hypothetical protein [Fontisphaera persica]WCJ59734.1 hypothetical protein NXS98_01055 [Fontisphaera persica]